MEDFRENWQTMPDADLRYIYRRKTKEVKRLGSIAFAPLLPALVIYGFLGWVGFAGYEYSGFDRSAMNFESGRALYYIALAVSSCLIRTARDKFQWVIFLPVLASWPLVKVLFGEFSIEVVLMLCYLGYAYIRLIILLPDIDFLKSLPRFPFDEHSAVRDIRIMDSRSAAEHLELSSGKAVARNYEDIFTAEVSQLQASSEKHKNERYKEN
ncbi:hypothetical protein [Ruminococcus sp.]|uniref:hypothetical protein n=1 Tax=Ruminococcus sp. TaxID=41978 RepID=UPI0025F39FF2|nr:hypothetical protein [Ruminococcus sp.]MBQ8967690.1 hypothetical protein [Ruminococcus sp.]